MGLEKVKMITAYVNGIENKFYYKERISPEHAPLGYPYMYHLRHDEDNWSKPITLERFVLVNFFGTVFTKEPVDFGENDYVEIEQFKMERKFVNIRLRRETLFKLFDL